MTSIIKRGRGMAKKLWSVFTYDMDHCYFTGSPYVERHHIFEGRQGYKEKSENRGFIMPLRYDLHPNGVRFKRTQETAQLTCSLKGWPRNTMRHTMGAGKNSGRSLEKVI